MFYKNVVRLVFFIVDEKKFKCIPDLGLNHVSINHINIHGIPCICVHFLSLIVGKSCLINNC